VGSERAAVMGESEGGPLSILFAAAHPERTVALILQGAEVRERKDHDWPWGEATDEEFEAWTKTIPDRWGKGMAFGALVPSVGDVEWGRELLARVQKNSCTPSAWEAFARMAFDIDVRHVVPAIKVPVLVIHAVEDQICHVENARFLANALPNASYVELSGGDHVPWFDPDETIAEIREFLTGRREAATPDRKLATVLFTDLVGSTTRATELGDRRWRDLLEQHHAAVRRELERFDGSEMDTAGDGFFATFDGPARAIRCAQSVIQAVKPLELDVRAGLHTGEVEVLDGKIAGIAVSIGARVAARADAGEVLVSGTVKDLVAGSGLEFEDRGVAELKGVPGEWRLYAVAA
jgi:class 3 adenylate cyclase